MMTTMTMVTVAWVLALVFPLVSSSSTYDGHQFILFDDTHRPGFSFLRRFNITGTSQHQQDALLHHALITNLDIWQITPTHVDIYLPLPSHHHRHDLNIVDLDISYTDSPLPSLSSLLPPSWSPSWTLDTLSNSTFHQTYHPLADIDTFVDTLVQLYPDLVTKTSIGHSSEGREMYALTISKMRSDSDDGGDDDNDGGDDGGYGVRDGGSGNKKDKKKENGKDKKKKGNGKTKSRLTKKIGFVITGAQHAREWIATSTAMYLSHALVADPDELHSLNNLLNHFDFHIVLVPNPDGYVYTWEKDRFWYKNRQIIGSNERCIGIDMNRNWGFKWKPTARFPLSSSPSDDDYDTKKRKPTLPADPCAPWYPGHRAFESPEVNNIANWVTTLPGLRAFIDLRSYGQMLSSPYSYSCKKTPKDAEDQVEAAMGAAHAIKTVHGTTFTTGRLCEMLYTAPGNIVDYMFAEAGIKYSYAAHLRDTGTYGFALPPEWIRPVGEETVSMVKSLAGFMNSPKF